MDIRDIKEKVEYPGIQSFESIFSLQKELLKGYIGIEGLPEYPIDLNTKKSQDLLKDFTGRIIEELGEGYESYEVMMNMFHRGIDESEMWPHLQNFNEEVSDALHFWLELMIYSGFETGYLSKWLGEYIKEEFLGAGIIDMLDKWLMLGAALVDRECPEKSYPCRMVIKDDDLDNEFLRGGRKLGGKRRDKIKQYLWDITYPLQIARNTLKNKPWKQTEMMTDVHQYEEQQKLVTVALFKFLAFTGFTKESIYEIYYKKNKVNLFRQKSRY